MSSCSGRACAEAGSSCRFNLERTRSSVAAEAGGRGHPELQLLMAAQTCFFFSLDKNSGESDETDGLAVR